MPDTSVTLPGRCSACGQAMLLPTADITSIFSCPRCNAEARGTSLMGSGGNRSLSAFDEAPEEVTRMHLPGGPLGDLDVPVPVMPARSESGRPLPSVSNASAAPPGVRPHPLQRFEDDDDAGEHQTRLVVPLSYEDEPGQAPMLPERRPAPGAGAGAVAAGASPFARGEPPPGLSTFDEDDPDQQTRLNVPLSYEDDPAPNGSLPAARATFGHSNPAPPVARLSYAPASTREAQAAAAALDASLATPAPIPLPEPYDLAGGAPPKRGLMDSFGNDALQLSIAFDALLLGRSHRVLVGTAVLTGVLAPLLDALLDSTQEAATVLTSNLMLFVLWMQSFAWLSRRRDDQDHWDPAVARSRLVTHWRVLLREFAQFGRLPSSSRLIALADLMMPVGVMALTIACCISISRTVWGWPTTTAGLFVWRFTGAGLVSLAAVARVQAAGRRNRSSARGTHPSEIGRLPAALDMALPLPGVLSKGTLLQDTLQALALWPVADWPNVDSYIFAIERHLSSRLPADVVATPSQLPGARRTDVPDLTINASLSLTVRRGFDSTVPERIATRMEAQARARGPHATLYILCDAPSSVLSGRQQDALQQLHDNYPITVVRLPIVAGF